MKALRHIIVAVTLVACTACQQHSVLDVGTDPLTDTPIRVNAGVDGVASRAGMTTGELTTLGLSIYNPASTQYSYANVKYEKNGSSFVAAAGQKVPSWQNKTQEVKVTAYSPYVENWAGDFAVETDQSTAQAVKASDLLWVQAQVKPDATPQTGNITYSNGALNIKLQHQMSKLVVNLRYLGEVGADAKVASLKVMYLSTGCTIDTETGAISNLGAPQDIIAFKEATAAEGYTDCFEAIFPPQHMAFKLVILLSDGKDYIYHNAAFDFQSDIAYVLNLAVGKDKVIVDSVTAKDWDVVAGGTLETDDKE